jgi:hypothetical protein
MVLKIHGTKQVRAIASLLASNFAEVVIAYLDGRRDTINNEQDFKIIKMFYDDISDFKKFGVDESRWRPKKTMEGLNLEEVKRAEDRMQEVVNRHPDALREILMNLNCSRNVLHDVIQKYKDGKEL